MARSIEQRLADLEQHAWTCEQERRDTTRQTDRLAAAIAELAGQLRAHGEASAGDGERYEQLKAVTWDTAVTQNTLMRHLGVNPDDLPAGRSTPD
jgi:chromosome segregation ATPase